MYLEVKELIYRQQIYSNTEALFLREFEKKMTFDLYFYKLLYRGYMNIILNIIHSILPHLDLCLW